MKADEQHDGTRSTWRRTAPERHTDITIVQQWVMSSLALVTVEHLATGLVILAAMMDPSRRGDRIGLLINAAVIGVLGVIGFRLIHKKRWLTAWLLLGTIPSLVGAYLIFWR
ncbi:MAG TPA: hypothetical protein VLK34_02405 [Nocardioidaceae bacterium]|nr:hypothetical protein [Nocardioidaceae bacterium]